MRLAASTNCVFPLPEVLLCRSRSRAVEGSPRRPRKGRKWSSIAGQRKRQCWNEAWAVPQMQFRRRYWVRQWFTRNLDITEEIYGGSDENEGTVGPRQVEISYPRAAAVVV